jgi:hypothetical protein
MIFPKKLEKQQVKLRARFTKSHYTILYYQTSCHTLDDGAIAFRIHIITFISPFYIKGCEHSGAIS